MKNFIVTGSFDKLGSRDLRLLQEAANFGKLLVFLWSDEIIFNKFGKKPNFPQEERKYFLDAVRYVDQTILIDENNSYDELPDVAGIQRDIWVLNETEDTSKKRFYAYENGIIYQVKRNSDLHGFPSYPVYDIHSQTKKVIVTGCFDWLHSGHVRFFEQTSQLGDLYVVVGHDENIRLLKGKGHPMFSQDERRYMVNSIKFVKQALISSGSGWMDAKPEIRKIKPDIYAVNEDGDKPNKRAFCEDHGIEYVVLKRTPAAGLPKRTSTNLRGF